jgi:hypothetical protein
VRRYVLDLHLSRNQMLRLYQGSASAVVGYARSGECVRFPLHSLRPFVDSDGISGTFELRVDARQRLQEIRRLSKA